MPNDIYDDPDINTGEEQFPDQLKLEHPGDHYRGRVLSVEKITTRYGPTLKYMLFDGQRQQSMLAGQKNLKAQLLELRPRPGDVLDMTLIELRDTANGRAYIYDVDCERGSAPEPPTPPVATPAPAAPSPGRPSMPTASTDDGEDLFDR
jgi:hypothetical protein